MADKKTKPKAASAPAGKRTSAAKISGDKVMTKTDLVRHLSAKADLTGVQVSAVLEELEKLAPAELKRAKKFVIPGVAILLLKHTPAKPERMGRNPATGEQMMFKAKPAGMDVKAKPVGHLRKTFRS